MLNHTINEKLIARDLTLLAIQGAISPKFPKDKELRILKEILCRRKRNRALLLGKQGVGKRVVVETLARSIVAGEVPLLNSKRILEINLRSLLDPGFDNPALHLDEFLSGIIAADNIILFIEDLELIYKDSERASAIRNVFTRYLENKTLRIIATTTPVNEKLIMEEYNLRTHFSTLEIFEPAKDECVNILMTMKHELEKFYGISLSEEVIKSAVELSNQYIHNKFQPDKAIFLLDASCAACYYAHHNKIIKENRKSELSNPAGEKTDNGEKTDITLTKDDLENYIKESLGIINVKSIEKQNELLGDLEELLSKEIIGQEEAITALCDILRMNLNFPELRGRKPKAIFLLLGPTGVGKTETARILAQLLFEKEESFIRLNMSEYSEAHSVSRLIGAPPGYVGYNHGIGLTELITRSPHCLLLLDEIEKAHPNVHNLFLQVFDEGKIRDSKGEIVDFRDTIIFMTGNLGSELLDPFNHVGFIKRPMEEIEVSDDTLDKEIRKYFPREFINRIDRIILFKPLKKETAQKIVKDKLLKHMAHMLSEKGIDCSIGKGVEEVVAEYGFNASYGVRSLERKFDELVTLPIGKLLCKETSRIKKLQIKAINDAIAIDSIGS